MKKIFKNTLILGLTLLSFISFSQEPNEDTFITYEFEKFRINLPSDMTVDDEDSSGLEFVIYANIKSGNEKILPNISGTVKTLNSIISSNFTTAEQYVKAYEGMLGLANEDFELIESIKTENNSHTVIYTSSISDEEDKKIKIKSFDTYYLKDKTIYLISFKASVEDYDGLIGKSKKAIFSLKFL